MVALVWPGYSFIMSKSTLQSQNYCAKNVKILKFCFLKGIYKFKFKFKIRICTSKHALLDDNVAFARLFLDNRKKLGPKSKILRKKCENFEIFSFLSFCSRMYLDAREDQKNLFRQLYITKK